MYDDGFNLLIYVICFQMGGYSYKINYHILSLMSMVVDNNIVLHTVGNCSTSAPLLLIEHRYSFLHLQ